MRWLGLGLALCACKYEDGTREHGQACWEDANCPDGLECSAICMYPEGSRDLGESCKIDDECADDVSDGTVIICDLDVDACVALNSGYIICNDGTQSPTCTECSSGCCSGHGGCE